MSHAEMKMQSLFMMMPVHAFKPWYKCLLIEMTWCKCFDVNTIYSKVPFVFKSRLPQRLNQNIFKTWFIIPEKSSFFFFYLRLLKKLVITIRNLQMRHSLGIWWSGSKDLFSQFGWAKGWLVSMAFFWKNEFFENQAS